MVEAERLRQTLVEQLLRLGVRRANGVMMLAESSVAVPVRAGAGWRGRRRRRFSAGSATEPRVPAMAMRRNIMAEV